MPSTSPVLPGNLRVVWLNWTPAFFAISSNLIEAGGAGAAVSADPATVTDEGERRETHGGTHYWVDHKSARLVSTRLAGS